MSSRKIQTPWGETTLICRTAPASPPDFDLASPRLREAAEPHFDEDHTIWVTYSLLGLERIDCDCGEVLFNGPGTIRQEASR